MTNETRTQKAQREGSLRGDLPPIHMLRPPLWSHLRCPRAGDVGVQALVMLVEPFFHAPGPDLTGLTDVSCSTCLFGSVHILWREL
jgi:hypothetical protein